MPANRLEQTLAAALESLKQSGRAKGAETVFDGVLPPADGKGPRYRIAGEPGRAFLRMNANGYLGLARHEAVIAAEEDAVRRYGAGPGAVRFISGTWAPHVALEARLAAFHRRPSAMLFSSAYATIMGVLAPLIDDRTAVISDALNHNCIINAMRLAQPKRKQIYSHLDMAALERALDEAVTSMRGDALLALREIAAQAKLSTIDAHYRVRLSMIEAQHAVVGVVRHKNVLPCGLGGHRGARRTVSPFPD